jgi:hypothetical protein
MKSIDYNDIKNTLKEIVCKIFNNYKKEYGVKNICGFAIYSDEDAMTICVALNTYDYFKDSIKDNTEYECDYKFNPEEWKTIVENDELNNLSTILEKINSNAGKKKFIEHKNNIYKLCIDVLDEMKNELYFNELKEDFVLLFSISDSDFTETIIEYNKKFNSKIIAKEYDEWVKQMEDDDRDDDDWEDED